MAVRFSTGYFEREYLHNSLHRDDVMIWSRFEVEKANHIYTLTEWQNLLIGKVCAWACR